MRVLIGILAVVSAWAQYVPAGAVFPTAAPASAIGPMDFYVDFAGTTSGTTLTTTILNNGTIGNANKGGWSITGTGLTATTHVANCTLGGSVQIDGTVYPSSHTTLGMAVDNSGTLRYILAAPPATGFTQATATACITIGTGTLGGSGLFDMISFIGDTAGKLVIAQLSTSKCGGTLGFDLETTTSGTNNSSCVSATSGNSYWVSLQADYVGGTASMSVYDSSFTLLGSVTQPNATGENIGNIAFGQRESGTSTGSNKFENMMVRYSGGSPYPMGPVNTTQAPVYWVAQSHNNHGSGGTTSLSTTKALDEHAGDTVVVTCSNENASGAATSVTNTAGETFTGPASTKSAANGQSISQWYTAVSADHASQAYTCNWPSSQFSNIDVQILHGANTSTPFDIGAVGNKASGADSATAAFTPSTSTGTNVQCAYIQAGAAITAGTNFRLLRDSTSDSMGCQLRINAPNSSQTGTMIHSNTSASMTTLGNYKQ